MSHELGSRDFDNLFAGSNQLPVSDGETLVNSADTVVRGQVMAKITSSGEWARYKSGGSGGQEIPRGIAAEAADGTAASVPVVVYKTGEFNKNALVFNGSDTLTEAVKNLLQDVNIHTKDSVDTDGVHS